MNAEQKQLVDLAAEMTEICRQHKVKFVIGFGCAIGVERNRGFLPWDDDIDLIITRKELEKLKKVFRDHPLVERELVTKDDYPEYHHSLARYVNTASTRLAQFRIMDGTPLGQLLEFFVFDPIPDGEEARKEYEKWLWLYTELQASVVVVARQYSPVHAIDRDLYYHYLERMKNEGRETVLSEIERDHLTFPEEECEWMACRWGSKLLLIRRGWWDHIEYREFEGRMLPFFRDNIEHLQIRYGYTWNIVPPSGEERTHDVIVRADVPYIRHIDRIRAKAEEEGLTEALQEFKHHKLEEMFARYDLQRLAAHSQRAFLAAMAVGLDDGDPFDRDRLKEYEESFEPFFEVLFRFYYAKWNMAPDISGRLKEKMFLTLLYGNRIDRCQLFLELYRHWEKHDDYFALIDQLWKLQRAKYGGEAGSVRRLLETIEEVQGMDEHIEVERGELWILPQEKDPSCLWGEAQTLFKTFRHQDDPELCYYMGALASHCGHEEMAGRYFSRAAETDNGVLQLKLKERFPAGNIPSGEIS